MFSSGLCGSVDWVLDCEPKGCWFDSQSGHMPGLQPRSGPQLGVHKRQPHIDVSLPLFLSPSPSPCAEGAGVSSIFTRLLVHFLLGGG